MSVAKRIIVAVIPAKADSTRLPDKNMLLLAGKPLLHHTIAQAKESSLIDKIYVSTDSQRIADFAKQEGVSVIMRPEDLTKEAPLLEVYYHALMNIPEKDVNLIVGLQPDNPDRKIKLNDAITYCLARDLDDLSSVGADGAKNGSFRIMKAMALKEKRISVNAATFLDDSTNIHSENDLRLAEIRLKYHNEPISMRIRNKVISKKSVAFVIAEGACNHMCDMQIAKKMIDEALAFGADAIKFQTYKAERLVAKDAASYWGYGDVKSQYEYYKNLDKFDHDEYKILFEYGLGKDIVVFSSPFDIKSADMLNELGMELFKIPSCLINDVRLLEHIARFNKPIILSTGGSDLEEIRSAVNSIYGQGNDQLILMACTLSYPTKNQDAHLLRIGELARQFPELIIGYSDHTEPDVNMVIPALAVALGAKVIEKHFTLDRSMKGSGHSFSIEPGHLKKMVENIRLTEEVLGTPQLKVYEAEKAARKNARMSLVANRDIGKGERLTEDLIGLKRPGTGLAPDEINKVLGKIAQCDIPKDSQIALDQIK